MKRLLRWYAGLPVTIVATSSLLVGLAFRSMEADGAITWGLEMLLVAAVPIALSGAVRGLLSD